MRDAHDHESRLNHQDSRVVQREPRHVQQDSRVVQRDARLIHSESRLAQHEGKILHHEIKLSHYETKLTHHDPRPIYHEPRIVHHEPRPHCDKRFIHHESRIAQNEPRTNHQEFKYVQNEPRPAHQESREVYQDSRLGQNESKIIQKESRLAHPESRLAHSESRPTHHESRGVHQDSRLAQNESKTTHHESRLAQQESKLMQHESRLIQRQMYLKQKVRCRKMFMGSVIASDAGSEVGRSRPSSVYRQRESKCWRKHVVSTDSGYSGTSRRQSETEDTELPTIYADVGPVVCLRLPTKCRKCRRIRNETKDASSQHSHPPSDDSRPSSPLTETLMSVVVDAPHVLLLPPPDRIFQCRVLRDKNSLGTNFYPVYRMYLERDAKADSLLLVARKRKKCSTSKYLILTGGDDMSRKSPTVVGKLRSNLVGTRFSLTTTSGTTAPTDSLLLFYETNILGTKGPRRMRVFLPEDGQPPLDLLDCYRRQAMNGVLHLVNKEPEWDKETLSHVLYFEGRVTKSSVKNFQLIIPPEDEVLLQFGKIGRDEFTLDYQRPLNAVQAFAIALSSFDYKIACE